MNLSFSRTNGSLDGEIDRLIETAGGVNYIGYVREMIIAALKAGQETDNRADIKLMNTTMKEMRFTSKIFGPYQTRRKVTIFGSARTRPEEPLYALARQVGRKLVDANFMVITGGGAGIMQAANEGAGAGNSFGVNIRLPFEQETNPTLEGCSRVINYKYFFNRKVAFLKEASAIALFPGGFGTLDEAMETLTLIQTGKRSPMPLVLVDEPGGVYWSGVLRFFKEELLNRGYISPTDFHLFTVVDSAEDAVEEILRFYRRYHSQRYVDEKLVLRLSSPLPADAVEELEQRFAKILLPGGRIVSSEALPKESDEPEILDLPRLIVDFDKRDFGLLRDLIDAVNRY